MLDLTERYECSICRDTGRVHYTLKSTWDSEITITVTEPCSACCLGVVRETQHGTSVPKVKT